jgi:hypothetical protein
MDKNILVIGVAVAVIAGGAGFWVGSSYAGQAQSQTASGTQFSARTGGRGFGGGNATIGTIVSVGNGTFTVQLPNATSTGATTGTRIVLFDSTTQVEEMQTVPATNLAVGKSVVVNGSGNGDGSITATTVQIRPAGTGGFGGRGGGQ